MQHENSYTVLEKKITEVIKEQNEIVKNNQAQLVTRAFFFSDEDIMEKLKTLDLDYIMSYNTIQRRTFLFSAVSYGRQDLV